MNTSNSYKNMITSGSKIDILNELSDVDYIDIREILQNEGSVFTIIKYFVQQKSLQYLVEITLDDLGHAKKIEYYNNSRDERQNLWNLSNPKTKRPHYQKRNIVCTTCRKTCTSTLCPICGDETRVTYYQIPRKLAVTKWENLITEKRF